MTPAKFIEKFDTIAEAPGGIERLRELVLQLAVRGKLVPQDPGDEPASRLLERIQLEARDAPKSRVLVEYEPGISAAMPCTWESIYIGDAMALVNGRAFKPTDWSTSGVPIVRIQNLNDPSASYNYCSFSVDERFYIDNGDLLLSWSGTPGTSFGAFIWNGGQAVLNQHIFRCEPRGEAFFIPYLRLAINSRLSKMIERAHGGVGLRHITKGKLQGLRLALPPLAEQHRIVAKVDEIMGLIDRLAAKRRSREDGRTAARNSTLAALRDAATPEEVGTAWMRIAERMDDLFTAPTDLAPLRETVLQLAVRGRLVPQEEGDKSASQLLERVRLEANQAPKSRVFVEYETDAASDMPCSWESVYIGEATALVNGRAFKPSDWSTTGVPIVRIQNLNDANASFNYCNFSVDDKFYIDNGDLLLSWSGTPGTSFGAFIWNGGRGVLNQHIFRCEPRGDAFFVPYLRLAINSRLSKMIERAHGGVGLRHITRGKLEGLRLMLPPLAEQHRIVAKVDELMELVDRLEQHLVAREKNQEGFAAAYPPF